MSESPAAKRPIRPLRTVESYMVETMNHIEAALETIQKMREQHGDFSPDLGPVERELWSAYEVAQAQRSYLPLLPKY